MLLREAAKAAIKALFERAFSNCAADANPGSCELNSIDPGATVILKGDSRMYDCVIGYNAHVELEDGAVLRGCIVNFGVTLKVGRNSSVKCVEFEAEREKEERGIIPSASIEIGAGCRVCNSSIKCRSAHFGDLATCVGLMAWVGSLHFCDRAMVAFSTIRSENRRTSYKPTSVFKAGNDAVMLNAFINAKSRFTAGHRLTIAPYNVVQLHACRSMYGEMTPERAGHRMTVAPRNGFDFEDTVGYEGTDMLAYPGVILLDQHQELEDGLGVVNIGCGTKARILAGDDVAIAVGLDASAAAGDIILNDMSRIVSVALNGDHITSVRTPVGTLAVKSPITLKRASTLNYTTSHYADSGFPLVRNESRTAYGYPEARFTLSSGAYFILQRSWWGSFTVPNNITIGE